MKAVSRRRCWRGLVLGLLGGLVWAATPQLPASIALIEKFEHSHGPYHDVRVTNADADAYWAGPGAARLPAGISRLRTHSRPGVIVGSATIDFDRLQVQGNPLLAMFSGTHTVAAEAQVDSGQVPAARLTLIQVSLDGHVIPAFLVEAAIDAFVRPHHPNIGRTFTIPLPRHALSVSAEKGYVLIRYPHS